MAHERRDLAEERQRLRCVTAAIHSQELRVAQDGESLDMWRTGEMGKGHISEGLGGLRRHFILVWGWRGASQEFNAVVWHDPTHVWEDCSGYESEREPNRRQSQQKSATGTHVRDQGGKWSPSSWFSYWLWGKERTKKLHFGNFEVKYMWDIQVELSSMYIKGDAWVGNFKKFWDINSPIYCIPTTGQTLCWEGHSQTSIPLGLHYG